MRWSVGLLFRNVLSFRNVFVAYLDSDLCADVCVAAVAILSQKSAPTWHSAGTPQLVFFSRFYKS